jgi:hypothetical protein
MFRGANYTANKSQHHHNVYGWDKAKVLKVSQKRETVTVYFYNTKPRKNSTHKHITNINFDEFYESFDMTYDLESIDGVHNA